MVVLPRGRSELRSPARSSSTFGMKPVPCAAHPPRVSARPITEPEAYLVKFWAARSEVFRTTLRELN